MVNNERCGEEERRDVEPNTPLECAFDSLSRPLGSRAPPFSPPPAKSTDSPGWQTPRLKREHKHSGPAPASRTNSSREPAPFLRTLPSQTTRRDLCAARAASRSFGCCCWAALPPSQARPLYSPSKSSNVSRRWHTHTHTQLEQARPGQSLATPVAKGRSTSRT